MTVKTQSQYYTLYETADNNGVKRRFLCQYEGDVFEVRRVFDQSTGREAFILDPNVAPTIRKHLDVIGKSDFNHDWILGMPDPIWERMLEDSPKIKAVEFRRITNLFPEHSSVVR